MNIAKTTSGYHPHVVRILLVQNLYFDITYLLLINLGYLLNLHVIMQEIKINLWLQFIQYENINSTSLQIDLFEVLVVWLLCVKKEIQHFFESYSLFQSYILNYNSLVIFVLKNWKVY